MTKELYGFINDKAGVDIYFNDDENGSYRIDNAEPVVAMDDPTEVIIGRLVNLIEELRENE